MLPFYDFTNIFYHWNSTKSPKIISLFYECYNTLEAQNFIFPTHCVVGMTCNQKNLSPGYCPTATWQYLLFEALSCSTIIITGKHFLQMYKCIIFYMSGKHMLLPIPSLYSSSIIATGIFLYKCIIFYMSCQHMLLSIPDLLFEALSSSSIITTGKHFLQMYNILYVRPTHVPVYSWPFIWGLILLLYYHNWNFLYKCIIFDFQPAYVTVYSRSGIVFRVLATR